MSAQEMASYVLNSPREASITLVLNHNMHSLYMFETNATFRALYERASKVLVDGWPILFLAGLGFVRSRESRKAYLKYRIGSTDWLRALERSGYRGRIALIGSSKTSLEQAVIEFGRRMPGAQVKGWDGFEGVANLRAEGLAALRAFEPDLILVGMGMPLQEEFILAEWDRFPPALLATVGGAFDYYSGAQVLAPRVLGPLGLEWLFRLCSDPKRLSHRYLVEPLKLAGHWIGIATQSSEEGSKPAAGASSLPIRDSANV